MYGLFCCAVRSTGRQERAGTARRDRVLLSLRRFSAVSADGDPTQFRWFPERVVGAIVRRPRRSRGGGRMRVMHSNVRG